MPIIGLTDRAARLPEIGQLRKGAPKPERGVGRDLTYFRFTSELPGIEARFLERYGEQPAVISPIYLMGRSPEESFEAWREHWVVGGLVHRCDGVTCVLWRDKDGSTYNTTPKPCPGETDPKTGLLLCKQTGRLSMILPELGRQATVCAITSSKWDIIHLQEQLSALYLMHGSLLGIPLVLRRASRQISVPGKDGKRARMAKSLLSIEAMPQWFELKLAELAAGARPNVPLLTAGAPAAEPAVIIMPSAPAEDFGDDEEEEIDTETGEIIEAQAVVIDPVPGPTLVGSGTPARRGNGSRATGEQKAAIINLIAKARQLRADAVTAEVLAKAGITDLDDMSNDEAAVAIQGLQA